MINLFIALQAVTLAQAQSADKRNLEAAITEMVICANQQAARLDDRESAVETVVSAVRIACERERGRVRDMFAQTTRSSSQLVGMPLEEPAVQRVADKSMAQADQSMDARIAQHILEDRRKVSRSP